MSFDADAWLVVARGGWWTAQEVAAQMPADLDLDPKVVHTRLWTMARRSRTLARRDGAVCAEYAVTPDCRPPCSLTVRQIMEAVGGGA